MPRVPRVSILILCQRKVDLLANCLRSLERNVPAEIETETIVLFNDTPAELRERVRLLLGATKVLETEANVGYPAGNNLAAREAQGEYLVFLNDDTEVQPDWLEALVEVADREADVGAVGSRMLNPDGTLQEAGSVIWSDGLTTAVGLGLPGDSPRYGYLRQVDYVSACSLLVRRETFERLGGFDERFFPGYNEDVDLCLGIHRLGQRVIYQPRSLVVHRGSSNGRDLGVFLVTRSRELLQEKWDSELSRFAAPAPTSPRAIHLAIHRARGSPRRLLMVDDRIPAEGLGSGFPRALQAIRELARDGYAITLYPTDSLEGDPRELQDLGVEIAQGDLHAHLVSAGTFYDAVIVSRPHNYDKAFSLVRRDQPQATVIYDAEALFYLRLERKAEVLRESDPNAAQLALRNAILERQREREIVRTVDRVVCVSEAEAQIVRSIEGHRPLEVIEGLSPHIHMTTAPFHERDSLVFVAGWLAPYPSANSDALEWLTSYVLPVVRNRVPWARLSVTGGKPHLQLLHLLGPSLQFVGHVHDLADVYGRARVAVVPNRYGSGIKHKGLEALQYGVPAVATSVGAEGIDGAGGPALAICDDPKSFAERISSLLVDPDQWEQARSAIAELHAGWERRRHSRWTEIVETALREKMHGPLALHG